MPRRYKKIKSQITKQYQSHYLKEYTSNALAENIKEITIDDTIYLLETVRDTPKLTYLSISLSRRSDLFDKLVLMEGAAPHQWVLRLHTYNMVAQSDEPGYVISNLNRKIRDDENHIHEHSWQLTSRFLMGGFRNHQYAKTQDGLIFNRFNLVPTSKDGVTATQSFRKAVLIGQTGIQETKDDLYQQGDLVHYPIEIPHKVDTSLASYVGMTITLAHTSERHHENSIFYEKNEEASHEKKKLAIESQKYTEQSHHDAINMAITNLKLLKLSDQLAEEGFERFNRFVDPITKELSPNNVLETELLPTIAMLALQRNDFTEYPMTAELQGKSQDQIQKLKDKYARGNDLLKKLINNAIVDMHPSSLLRLISVSQQNLMAKLYTASRNALPLDALKVLKHREQRAPEHVLHRMRGFFSNAQSSNSKAGMLIEEEKGDDADNLASFIA